MESPEFYNIKINRPNFGTSSHVYDKVVFNRQLSIK